MIGTRVRRLEVEGDFVSDYSLYARAGADIRVLVDASPTFLKTHFIEWDPSLIYCYRRIPSSLIVWGEEIKRTRYHIRCWAFHSSASDVR